ncbi:XdhC family protein [Croceibacterium aestuarii]|uniref:XdhC family protein n=1 Tax=Croceibacterium aestuarii TaxID=3064139 RepID=UPI00272E7885|nr:XdhC family protein [Croceibacterium sp. D39]
MASPSIPHDHAALAHAAGGDAVLCTIVGIDGSFSRRVGTQLAVDADKSRVGDMADQCLDDELASQAVAARAEGKPRLLRYGKGSPMVDFRLPCGAGLDIWIDPAPNREALRGCVAALHAREEARLDLALPADAAADLLRRRGYIPAPRLVLLGAGSECASLVALCAAQGIAVEWREAGRGLDLGRAPEGIEVDAWTAILLLFHDHEWEHALLQWALGTPAFLIGAQGGAPAREERTARLRAAGRSEADLARIKSPVGLIPRARDPRVLALSVLSELVGAYERLHTHA